MTDCLLVMTTTPDAAVAKCLAHKLLENKLAACVSLMPAMTSLYHWQGDIHESTEHLLLIKTQTMHYQAIETFLLTNHPYDLPEIIATTITQGLPAYLGWIKESTQE